MNTKPNIALRLATAGSLDSMKHLIAEFYVSKPERITLVDCQTYWSVRVGEKTVTPIVVQGAKRFVFGSR